MAPPQLQGSIQANSMSCPQLSIRLGGTTLNCQPTPADDGGTDGKATALKRDGPAAGAAGDQDEAGLGDLFRSDETPSKRQAATSASSSSHGESEVKLEVGSI
jgi:hypothetical protein